MRILKLISYTFVYSICICCARTGSPTGGDKDQAPPVLVQAVPTSQSVNFTKNRIRLYFDEYIVLKDIQKQLIISPPLNYFPEISPLGHASKHLDIKILDTLKANTTYAFNFGNSIQDYNENNAIPFLKYVFSTGAKIDSLSVKGEISDALLRKTDNFVNVMLYEITENTTDSIIYKQKPTYITNTLDSLKTFEITHVKAGKYLLVAIKDKANNYLFNQKQDKIAFLEQPISVPSDSIYKLSLFEEIPNRKTARPFQSAEKRISIGYEGDTDSLRIKILPPMPNNFSYVISKHPEKDTLNLWLSHKIEDSLRLVIGNEKIDTFRVNFRKMKPDSLLINHKSKSISPTLETLTFTSNIPIDLDKSKISIISMNDSTRVLFKEKIDTEKLNVELEFATKPSEKYKIIAYPKAFTDFYGTTNDTITANVTAKTEAEFATFKLKLNQEIQFPILIELIDSKEKMEYQQYVTEPQPEYVFNFVKAGKYFVRIVQDRNKNRKWDTGNYLKKIQPEKVFHLPKEIDLRPNWEIKETF